MPRWVAGVLPAAVAGGCELISEPAACALLPAPAVEVAVRDASTGALAAFGARGLLQTGTYADSLRPWGSGDSLSALRLAGFGPEGAYSVHVEKAGYLPWQASGVQARGRERCNQTVKLDARLVRAGP